MKCIFLILLLFTYFDPTSLSIHTNYLSQHFKIFPRTYQTQIPNFIPNLCGKIDILRLENINILLTFFFIIKRQCNDFCIPHTHISHFSRASVKSDFQTQTLHFQSLKCQNQISNRFQTWPNHIYATFIIKMLLFNIFLHFIIFKHYLWWRKWQMPCQLFSVISYLALTLAGHLYWGWLVPQWRKYRTSWKTLSYIYRSFSIMCEFIM